MDSNAIQCSATTFAIAQKTEQSDWLLRRELTIWMVSEENYPIRTLTRIFLSNRHLSLEFWLPHWMLTRTISKVLRFLTAHIKTEIVLHMINKIMRFCVQFVINSPSQYLRAQIALVLRVRAILGYSISFVRSIYKSHMIFYKKMSC